MAKLTLGLCRGRHDIPNVTDYVFDVISDPTNLTDMSRNVCSKLIECTELTLYVTGLTVALVEVIGYCSRNCIPLTLMHYNSVTGDYYTQRFYGLHPDDVNLF